MLTTGGQVLTIYDVAGIGGVTDSVNVTVGGLACTSLNRTATNPAVSDANVSSTGMGGALGALYSGAGVGSTQSPSPLPAGDVHADVLYPTGSRREPFHHRDIARGLLTRQPRLLVLVCRPNARQRCVARECFNCLLLCFFLPSQLMPRLRSRPGRRACSGTRRQTSAVHWKPVRPHAGRK